MIYSAYYDALRRLVAGGDVTKRITHVALGSSQLSPNVEVTAITDAVLTPVTSVDYHPSDARRVTFHFLLPLDEGVGLVIREVALVCADGTLVYREVRKPIEKTADMEFGDRFELQV